MASEVGDRASHHVEPTPFSSEQSRESQVERQWIPRQGPAMKPEGEVGLFREEGQISEFPAFRTDNEIAREVAFADGVGAGLNCKGSTEIAFRRVKYGQSVERLYDVGMLYPLCFLLDSQRALGERFGVRVV